MARTIATLAFLMCAISSMSAGDGAGDGLRHQACARRTQTRDPRIRAVGRPDRGVRSARLPDLRLHTGGRDFRSRVADGGRGRAALRAPLGEPALRRLAADRHPRPRAAPRRRRSPNRHRSSTSVRSKRSIGASATPAANGRSRARTQLLPANGCTRRCVRPRARTRCRGLRARRNGRIRPAAESPASGDQPPATIIDALNPRRSRRAACALPPPDRRSRAAARPCPRTRPR